MSVANKIGVVDDSYKKRTEEFRTLNYSNLEISFTVDLANYSRHDDLHVTTPTQLLFNERMNGQKTLAERLRPKEFSEFVGQDHLDLILSWCICFKARMDPLAVFFFPDQVQSKIQRRHREQPLATSMTRFILASTWKASDWQLNKSNYGAKRSLNPRSTNTESLTKAVP